MMSMVPRCVPRPASTIAPHMPVGAIAALPPDQLALLSGEAAEALERAQRIKDWLDAAVDLKYRDRATAARTAQGKSTGTIRFQPR